MVTSESSILVENNCGEDEEIVSHSIVEETNHNETEVIAPDNSFHSDGVTIQKVIGTWKPHCKLLRDEKMRILESSSSSCKEISYNIRKKSKIKRCNKLAQRARATKTNEVMSIILKNKARYENNFSKMKVMINPQTGEHILRNNYMKPSVRKTFPIEPWMLDKPRILQQSDEKLFILKSKNCSTSANRATANSLLKTEAFNGPTKPRFQMAELPDLGLDFANDSFLPPSRPPKIFKKQDSKEKDASCIDENSHVVYWKEGNIDEVVSDYLCLSKRLQKKFPKSDENVEFKFPEYLGLETYECTIPAKYGAAPGIRILQSWNAVKERIENLQEETMTKFIFENRSPTFSADPQPFQPIYFYLDKMRKNVRLIIPKTGIPFIFLGTCLFSCHLGKRKFKIKEEDVTKQLVSKKIGCPAILSVAKVARFPDFDISELSPNCEREVLRELRDAWDYSHSKVRYYIEYHLKEPSPSDHKGHEVQYLINNNRFKEPVDPRILEKIRDLVRSGVTGYKNMHEKVQQFVREEMFKLVSDPPLERRRYNPSQRDIRYAMVKAKEELKKEGKSLVQLQCSGLANEISHLVKDITHEEYLGQIKSYLSILWKNVKAKEPLEGPKSHGNTHTVQMPAPKRISRRKQVESISTSPTPAVGASLLLEPQLTTDALPEQVIEQFYISVPETNDGVFSSQLYSQEDFVDMNGDMVMDTLPTVPDDVAVTEVYYYYPDGTCELAGADALNGVQP